MKSNCRFLRVKEGISYFAQVWLDLCPGGESIEIVNALPEQVNADTGEANQQSAPMWVAAALNGIRAALAHAQQVGVLTTGCRVDLLKLVGSFIDTREDVVRCAAALAVWQGLGSPPFAPEAEFDGQRWDLLFPKQPSGLPLDALHSIHATD